MWLSFEVESVECTKKFCSVSLRSFSSVAEKTESFCLHIIELESSIQFYPRPFQHLWTIVQKDGHEFLEVHLFCHKVKCTIKLLSGAPKHGLWMYILVTLNTSRKTAAFQNTCIDSRIASKGNKSNSANSNKLVVVQYSHFKQQD